MARPHLSNREFEVVECASRGLTDKQIGQELGISPGTIHTHWGRILAKLKAKSRAEAVAWLKSGQAENMDIRSGVSTGLDGRGTALGYTGRSASGSIHSETQLLRRLPLVVLLFDLGNRKVLATYGQTYHTFGFLARELIEMGEDVLSTIVEPEDLTCVHEALSEAVRARVGNVSEVEFRVCTPSGRRQWVEVRLTPFDVDGDGLVRTALVTCRNITSAVEELRAVKESLRSAESMATLLSIACETIPLGVVVFDSQRRIVRANGLAVRRLGVGGLAPAVDSRQSGLQGMAPSLFEGRPGEAHPWHSTAGQTEPCSVSWAALHDPTGGVAGYVVLVHARVEQATGAAV